MKKWKYNPYSQSFTIFKNGYFLSRYENIPWYEYLVEKITFEHQFLPLIEKEKFQNHMQDEKKNDEKFGKIF